MTPVPDRALVLFARDPVPGQVKTRLHPVLDPESACLLYRAFVEDTLDLMESITGVDRFIGVHPSPDSGFFARCAERGFRLFAQEGKDLGERMERALARRLAEGYRQVVLIGSDSPTLPPAYLKQALASDRPLVLGPSTDGGYYLVAMREALFGVFQEVPWGTGRVLEATCRNLEALDLVPGLLPPWYDIDRPEDLRFLKTHLDLMSQAGCPAAPATRACLARLPLKA